MKVTDKLLRRFFEIYTQLYENPFMSQNQIARNTGIPRGSISRYLEEMYERSIMKGPQIFVKPAQNYHLYASFCQFEDPYAAYKGLKELPHVVYRSWNCGEWNITLIIDTLMNFSVLKGFKECIHQGVKSVTYLPKVTTLDWDKSLKKIQQMISTPKEKTTFYEEIPINQWNNQEWILYNEFKDNTRVQAFPILKKYKIRYETVEKWISEIPQYASIHTGFYPQGASNYFASDFLFQSDFHSQLTNVLGSLPSTSVFFSVGQYLLARLCVLTKSEENDLISLIYQLKEKGYFSQFRYARALFE
ncbi:MAG: winged helix-turn-helix domain-containing protein [Theionarchaea archaeon]|nr:winged helix-turn-helix domain-containing protein [Theionarchaea archaeon]